VPVLEKTRGWSVKMVAESFVQEEFLTKIVAALRIMFPGRVKS